MSEKLTETITVRMSQRLRERIENQAEQDHRKVSDVIRLILEQTLATLPETAHAQKQGG